MMAKPMKTLELPYPMIQFLIILHKFRERHQITTRKSLADVSLVLTFFVFKVVLATERV